MLVTQIMFHDLSCVWHEANALAQRERTVMAIRLGIDSVALANEVSDPLSDRDRFVCMHSVQTHALSHRQG